MTTLSISQTTVRTPYPGLHPFTEADAGNFHGRERYVERLAWVVHRLPVMSLVGVSGSGKTSLVHAGLIPRLTSPAEANINGANVDWQVARLRPGARPFHSLADALSVLRPAENLDHTEMAETLRRDKRWLPKIVAQILDDSATPSLQRRLLIVVDQLEELYTLCPDPETRRHFLDTLLLDRHHPNPRSPSTLLLILRADFAGPALAHRPLAGAIQRSGVVLGPMGRAELRRVIEVPAHSRGVTFEPGLVERLLDDVENEPGRLPALQFTLARLWKRQSDGQLTHAAYDEIGGVAGALARYADQVYASFEAPEQRTVRRIFLRLVQVHAPADDVSWPAPRDEFGEEDWPLVQKLSDAGLVATHRSPAGQETADVAHEALISAWDRLQAWLDVERHFRTWRQRLRDKLVQWEAGGRDAEALLRGAALAEAEEWADTRAGDLSTQERAFIEASLAQREAEQRAADEERRRQLTRVQAQADEARNRAQAEARGRQRLRYLAAGLAVMFLLALAGAIWARQQQGLAIARENQAVAGRATAEAIAAAQSTEIAVHSTAETAAAVAARATATAGANAQATEVAVRRTAEAVAVSAQATAQAETQRRERHARLAEIIHLVTQSQPASDDEPGRRLFLVIEALNAAQAQASGE